MSSGLLNLQNIENKVLCKIHSKNLDAYCFTDKQLICIDCILENKHTSHDLLSIKSGYEKYILHVTEKFEELRKKQVENKEKISSLLEIKECFLSIKESRLGIIKIFFCFMKKLISEREDLLINRVATGFNKEFEKLNDVEAYMESKKNMIDAIENEKKNMLNNENIYEVLLKSKELSLGFEGFSDYNNEIMNKINQINTFGSCWLNENVISNDEKENIIYIINNKENTIEDRKEMENSIEKMKSKINSLIQKIKSEKTKGNSVGYKQINKFKSLNRKDLNYNVRSKSVRSRNSNNSNSSSNVNINYNMNNNINYNMMNNINNINNSYRSTIKNKDSNIINSSRLSFNTLKNEKTKKESIFPNQKVKKNLKNHPPSYISSTKKIKKEEIFMNIQGKNRIESEKEIDKDIELSISKIEKEDKEENDNDNDDKLSYLNNINYYNDENDMFSISNTINSTKNSNILTNISIQHLPMTSQIDTNISIGMSLLKPKNQSIYIIGGKPDKTIIKYDIESNTFSNICYKNEKKQICFEKINFQVVQYKSKLLFIGGKTCFDSRNNFIDDSIYSYDIDKMTLKVVTNRLKLPKHSFISAYINNKLFIIGGGNEKDTFNSIEYYDKLISKWIDLKKMSFKRKSFASCVGFDNCIYVFGGLDDKEQVLKTCEKYDLDSNKWIRLDDFLIPRRGHQAICLPDGIYIIGGNDGNCILKSCEKYDFMTKKWKLIGAMNYGKYNFSANSTYCQYIFTFGGMTNGDKIINYVERYDLFNNKWDVIGKMPVLKSGHCSILVSQ